MANDIRDIIFATIHNNQYTAQISTERTGILSGIQRLKAVLAQQQIAAVFHKQERDLVTAGECILTVTGNPKDIAVAEEFIVGMLSKASGIATAAKQAVDKAGKMRIVSGAWKKMPPEIKMIVREAVSHGGAHFRILDVPFLYLDKNFVCMLGGIKETLCAVEKMPELKCIQLKGHTGDIAEEAVSAARYGASVIMVDTGSIADLRQASQKLQESGCRSKVQLAFAKGITLQDIEKLQTEDIDILDIGVQIVDAPLLDMKLDVVRSSSWN
jgi:nicotinate-nucleotide pyrophosphorylase (carboxylating)